MALLTVNEVAELLSCSTQFVRDHASRQHPLIPCIRMGSMLRFRAEDIAAFIEQQRNAPPFRKSRQRGRRRIQ
jgi:excisionase family DNA binding protein